MVVMTDLQAQLEKLDVKIMSLVAERARLCEDAAVHDQPLDAETEEELLTHWRGLADDADLDEVDSERLIKSLNKLCRKEEEE